MMSADADANALGRRTNTPPPLMEKSSGTLSGANTCTRPWSANAIASGVAMVFAMANLSQRDRMNKFRNTVGTAVCTFASGAMSARPRTRPG